MMIPNFDGLGVALLLILIGTALICFGLGYWVCSLIN